MVNSPVVLGVANETSICEVGFSVSAFIVNGWPCTPTRCPPSATVTVPPVVPMPPSVAPDATETAPVAAVCVPLIRSVPAVTVVAPV